MSAGTKIVAVPRPQRESTRPVKERYALELEALAAAGAEIVEVAAATAEEFVAGARSAQAVLAYGTAIDEEVIAGLASCKVIGVGSVGVDRVDVDAATRAGIVVTNVPDIFIEEVADHTLMLLLSAARRARQMDEWVRRGEWDRGRPLLRELPRLLGQTLGLISFGNVARAVARRARPFGFRILTYDPYISELTITAEGVEPVSLGELLARSDFVSMHAPLNDETRHLLSGAEFQAMKETAILVNTGRGPTVDEAALIDALRQGTIAGAALDVLEQEPPDPQNPLLEMANVVLTPHVASATSRMMPETRRRVGREVALVLRGRWPRSAVNPQVLPRVALERWQPYPMERGPNR